MYNSQNHKKQMQQPKLLHESPLDKLYWERTYWTKGYCHVAGVDEAGRGCWAGPVVAAAVIFNSNTYLPEINDSKKLKAEIRDKLYDVILSSAVSFAVGIVSNQVIDQINILQASLVAMGDAVSGLKIKPDFILVDGNHGLSMNIPNKPLIKGDALSMTIGAASIVAKVTRDRLMQQVQKEFPQFSFGIHKGYGTRAHQEELKKYGPTSCHRMTFRPIREMVDGE